MTLESTETTNPLNSYSLAVRLLLIIIIIIIIIFVTATTIRPETDTQ